MAVLRHVLKYPEVRFWLSYLIPIIGFGWLYLVFTIISPNPDCSDFCQPRIGVAFATMFLGPLFGFMAVLSGHTRISRFILVRVILFAWMFIYVNAFLLSLMATSVSDRYWSIPLAISILVTPAIIIIAVFGERIERFIGTNDS